MSFSKILPKSHFLILYASETGQAKSISEEIADKAAEYGLKPTRCCMSLIDKRFSIERETCVVFVVSTTGDGQPPDTAVKFFRRLNRSTFRNNHLEQLNYALLALGDSNYLKFAAFGRQLEYRLKALSANCFYPTGYGDDAYGIETGVDPWIDKLWPALHRQLGLDFRVKSFMDCYNLQNSIKNGLISEMDSTCESIQSLLETDKFITDLSLLLKETDVTKCHVPKFPSPLYTVVYDKDKNTDVKFHPNDNILIVPASSVVKASLIDAKKLTDGEDVKNTLELSFQFEEEIVEYEPGDSFGFLCPNDSEEVEMLLTRLNLSNVADVPAQLIVNKDCTTKKKMPSHIPDSFTLRELFSHSIEIRSVPKKILLRIFAEYAEVEDEKLCLLFLSSQEGSDYFSNLIRLPSLSILDILSHFKSCNPPVEKIIEYLPPLKPRFYSVACSPLVDKKIFKIVFNVLSIKAADGRIKDRKGVCTGWFHDMVSTILTASPLSLTDQLSALQLDDLQKSVYVYKRKNQHFKFPNDLKTSVIMIGPGTGIAPFIGYLQHREKLLQLTSNDDGDNNGEAWLFYGCRYKERDYLYREELSKFVKNGTLQHLVVSHSRDHSTSDSTPRYVHESIKLQAKEISNCIRSGGKIYVCGDAKRMVHDVQQAFIEAVKAGFDIRESEAKKLIESLQKEHRYLNDVWA